MKKIFSTLILGLVTVLLVGHAVPVLAQSMDKESAKARIAEAYPELSTAEVERLYQKSKYENLDLTDQSVLAGLLEEEEMRQPISFGLLHASEERVDKISEGSYVVSLTLHNSGESLAGLRYRLVAVPTSGEGSAGVVLPQDDVISLASGGSIKIEIPFKTTPESVGEHVLKFEVANDSGLMVFSSFLDRYPLILDGVGYPVSVETGSCVVLVDTEADKRFTPTQGVDIAINEKLSLRCALSNSTGDLITLTPEFVTHKRSIWGDVVDTQRGAIITVQPGSNEVDIVLPKMTIPQAYDVTVRFVTGQVEVAPAQRVHYVLQGESATIQDLTLDKTTLKSGEPVLITLAWVGSADSFFGSRQNEVEGQTKQQNLNAEILVTGTTGEVCVDRVLSPLAAEQGMGVENITLTAAADCAASVVTARILNQNGTELAKVVKDFSDDNSPANLEQSVTGEVAAGPDTPSGWILYASILLGVVGLIALVRFFSRRPGEIATMAIVGVLIGWAAFSSVLITQAARIEYDAWSVSGQGWAYHGLDVDVTGPTGTDLTYAPPASVSVSGSVTNAFCSNSWEAGGFYTIVWRNNVHVNTYSNPAVSSFNRTLTGLSSGSYKVRVLWQDARCITVNNGRHAPANPNDWNNCSYSSTYYEDYYFTVISPPTITLTSDKPSVDPNDPATLTWTVSGANSCTASDGWDGTKSVSGGTVTVRPAAQTTYKLSCIGDGGTASKSVTIYNPSGTLDAGDCPAPIPPEGSSCQTTVSWQANNFINTPALLQGTTLRSSAPSSVGTSYAVSPDTRTFTLDDTGGRFSISDAAGVRCADDSVWVSRAGRCIPEPRITITPNPDIIRSGETAEVEIEVDSAYDLSCTVAGGITDTFSHPDRTSGPIETYSFTTRPLTAAQMVQVDCEIVLFPEVDGRSEARINVIPVMQEI